jgi:hypothetical protein
MVAGFLEEQLFRWLRAAELTCDRAALLVVKDPMVPCIHTFRNDVCFCDVTGLASSDNVYCLLSRGFHVVPDEAGGRVPIPSRPVKCGRLSGAGPLVRQGLVEPGWVVHPVRL